MIVGLEPDARLHLLGVAGTAMGSLAVLLARLGYRVTGSDEAAFPPMSDLLERERIGIRAPFAPANLPADCRAVVVGNAVSRGNPELEAALDRQLPLVSFPETLRELVLRSRVPVVVAGTHGKTSTTALLAWILRASGRDAGFLVGGVARGLGGSSRLGAAGEPFVLEGDEYDTAYWDKGPKFLHYLPEVAIVGNVEFDHADIYADFAAVRRAFGFFARLPPRRGLLLLGAESPAALALRERAHTTVQTFGLAGPSDWTAAVEAAGPAGTRIAPAFRGARRPALEGPFWGKAQTRNVLAAAAAADWLGVPWGRVREAVARFTGVARRLEVLAGRENGGVLVARDFAHHPTAVAAVLEAASRRWPDSRLVAVFEPRSFTARSARFQEAFGSALAAAGRVLLASPAAESRGRRPDRGAELDLERLAGDLDAAGTPAAVAADRPELLERVLALAADPGPMVLLFLSNGHFGGVPEEVASRIAATAPAPDPAG